MTLAEKQAQWIEDYQMIQDPQERLSVIVVVRGVCRCSTKISARRRIAFTVACRRCGFRGPCGKGVVTLP